jgi:shikimate dehydrogenase
MSTSPLNLGLTGWPLEHSYSPHLHQAALRTLGLAGEYRLYPLPPTPEGEAGLAALLQRLRGGELRGLNVTIPHKQTVIPWLDELTPLARGIGAVNTLYAKDGRLAGDNTDAPGFLADLKDCFPFLFSLERPTALVLGAGGAARAVVYALAQAGWQVKVASRRAEQAAALFASFAGSLPSIQAAPLEPGLYRLPCHLIVNTTPVGMYPNIQTSPWPENEPIPEGAAVYDLVYNPIETKWVRTARAAGHPAANGLGMLVEQAAMAFELWSGQAAPREAMRQAASLLLLEKL